MVAVGVRLSRGIRSLDASQREHGTFKLYQPCKVSRTVRDDDRRTRRPQSTIVPERKTRLSNTPLHLLHFSNNLHLDPTLVSI